jgi:hypothetical protein
MIVKKLNYQKLKLKQKLLNVVYLYSIVGIIEISFKSKTVLLTNFLLFQKIWNKNWKKNYFLNPFCSVSNDNN